MHPSEAAAKVLKRAAQLGRLGPRGLLRTAYVRTMAPAVYRLADAARSSTSSLHRQRCLTRALPARLERLRARFDGKAPQGESAGVLIDLNADPGRFVQTLEALLDLGEAGCPVPPVTSVDWKASTITIAQAKGVTLRQRPAPGAGGPDDAARLEECLIAIHEAGYVLGAIDEDSVLFTGAGKMPVVVGLGQALPIAGLSRDMSIYLRDLDRCKFNRLFGTALVTATRLRAVRTPSVANDRGARLNLYAPVLLRNDISWGKIWNTDVGIGRWNFIMKDHLPIPSGGTVLDLGSNNGFNPLQMLRHGAAAAVGVEIDEGAIAQGKFLKRAFEWLDNRSYDFRYIQGSQADLAQWDLPRFDVVTALCSLYYLPEPQIRELVRYLHTRTDVLVLQCNTDRLIDRSDPRTYLKASVPFALELLEAAGFARREIVAPAGYSRPLVIARSQ
jgi:SAM-dependent methyltransferase